MSEYIMKDNYGRILMIVYFPNYRFDFASRVHDRVDIKSMVNIDNPDERFVGDIKTYDDPAHPRNSDKFPDYQVDYDKLKSIKKEAKKKGFEPLLVVFFTDRLIIWNLNKSTWESTAKWVLANKDGCNYGKKEWDLQAYLYLKDAVLNVERNKELEATYLC